MLRPIPRTRILAIALMALSAPTIAAADPWTSCRAALSARRLAELATTAGEIGDQAPHRSRALMVVLTMDMDSAAARLVQRSLEAEGWPAGHAAKDANAELAAGRLAIAVRSGVRASEAYVAIPETRYGNAFIAALDLLGLDPHGAGLRPFVGPAERRHAEELAALLVRLADGLQGRQKAGALEYAAEIRALLGNHDSATEILLGIQRGEDWGGNISPNLINPTIAEAALKDCRENDTCRARVLHRAAMVAGTSAEAEAMLHEAFEIHRNRKPWPDFDQMAKVVGLAVEAKQPDLALHLAKDLDNLAQTARGIFPSFPHIDAAEALIAAGASADTIRAALERAAFEMPGSGGQVVGLGHRGPITWDGIGAEARWTQAALWARIGEVDRVAWLLDEIEQAPLAWGEVLGPDVAPATLDQLLALAKGKLGQTDEQHLRAATAAEMFRWDSPLPQRDWGLRTARIVVAQVDPSADRALATCRAAAVVAEGMADDALRKAALACAGESAIYFRDAAQLLEAAALWFSYETAMP